MLNLKNNKWVRCIEGLSPLDIEILNPYCFITAKPVVYLINLSEQDYIRKKNKLLPKIVGWIKDNVPRVFIPYYADFEQKYVPQKKKEEDEDKI